MRLYRHKQTATVTLGLVAICVLASVGFARGDFEGATMMAVVMAVIALALALFSVLTVTVTERALSFAFGLGLFRREYAVRDIADVRAVTNRWYYGWGIHLTPHGWLYNVAGLDAVELELADGRTVRVGTDEPERLLAAVRQAMGRGS